jgi:peptidoglycan/LPS O-acetylase OafA/YrhL
VIAADGTRPAGTHSSETADQVPSTTREQRIRVPVIDGFRGYAAIAVLLFHVTYAAGRPPLDEGIIRSVLISGYMGVDFFFVISGFVLFLPAVTNGGRLGDLRYYALRRAARILPAYYLVLVAVVVLHPAIVDIPTALPHTSLRGLLSFVLHLTFLEHTIGLLVGMPEGFAIHGAVWTLTLEALFYVLLPLIAGWYFRHPLVGLAAALAVSVLWKYAAIHVPFSVSWVAGGGRDSLRLILVTQLPTYAAHFAAGMTGAWLFVRLRSVNARSIAAGAALAQALALIVIILSMRSAGIRDVQRVGGLYTDASGRWYYEHWTGTTHVALAFAVLLVATALAPRWGRWPVTNRVARALGDASYGVYLWHLVVIGFALQTLHFAPDGTGPAFLRMLTVTLVASLIAGWLSFVFVERPFIRWAQRRSRGQAQAPATVAPPQPAQVPTVPYREAH